MAFRAMAADGAGKFVAVARDEIDGRGFVVRQYGASGAVNWTTRVSFASWMGTTGYPIATASAVSVQHDGKILVAGDIWTGTAYRFAMARLNPTGAVDTTFGTAGLVVTAFTGADARANAIAIDPLTGAITLAGFAAGNVALARYTATGAPDTTFGTAGKLTIDLGSAADIAYGLTIDAAGGLIVTGRKNNDMAVVRLLAGGSADTLFGDNHDGKEIIDLGGQEYAYSAAADSQNRIVIAGETTPSSSTAQLALVRLTATGHLDATFNSNGKWITSFYNLPGYLRAVAIDSQDRILFAGGVLDSDHGRVVLGRVNTNGTLDNSFAESGMKPQPPPGPRR